MSSFKRKCKFNAALQKQYPHFVASKESQSVVICSLCKDSLNISGNWKYAIEKHIKTKKHQSKLNLLNNKHFLICNINKNVDKMIEINNLAIAEGVNVYHGIKHNISFKTHDCTSKINHLCFDSNYSCGKTKATAIANKVFMKDVLEKLIVDLNQTNFVSMGIDTSNKKSTKICPIIVRYFNFDKGIVTKILDIDFIAGEKSLDLFECIKKSILKFNLKKKIVSLSADNTNSNFGGLMRNGKNNLFFKLSTFLDQKIIGVGCPAHIYTILFEMLQTQLLLTLKVLWIKYIVISQHILFE